MLFDGELAPSSEIHADLNVRMFPGEVNIRVTKFYRPEDTFRGTEGSTHNDLHMLYYSSEGRVPEDLFWCCEDVLFFYSVSVVVCI